MLAATNLARKYYGCSMSEASRIVDELTRQGSSRNAAS
jgi:hypothetical protein